MSNTINWGKIYEKTAWGIGVVTNTINWGKIYADLVGLLPSFALNFANITNDFTFTRSSFATRVNEQGLIETVTNLGSELIDYSAIGSPSGGWSLVNGKWFFDDVTSGYIETENFDVVVGEQYEVTVDVTISSGDANFRVSNSNAQTILFDYTDFPNGVTKFVTTVTGVDGSIKRLFSATALVDNPFTLNSISIKKVLEDDVPRIDYSTGEAAFLLEPQSTNLLTYSEDFSQWTALMNPTITLNQAISPDGTNNATLLEFDQTSADSRIEYSISSSGASDWVFSIWAKSVSGNDVSFGMEIGGAGGLEQEKVATSEWKRFYRVGSTTGNVNIYPQIEAWTTNNESIYIWGAQVEALPYATSYIPTNGSVVTRSGETCLDATVSANSLEGVLYAEISALADDGGFRLFSLNDGTSSNRVQIYYSGDSNKIISEIRIGGSGTTALQHVVSDVTDFHKVAFKYKQNDFALWIDGVEVDTSNVGSVFAENTLTELDFSAGSASVPFYGNTKDLKIYDKALTDEELTKLTTI